MPSTGKSAYHVVKAERIRRGAWPMLGGHYRMHKPRAQAREPMERTVGDLILPARYMGDLILPARMHAHTEARAARSPRPAVAA